MGCHFLLQGIFPTQELNLSLLQLLHWQAGSLPLSHPGNPFACLFGSCVLDPSTDTGTWVLEEGGLGFNPCCAVLVGSGHITTHFGCHRRAAFNLEMIGVLCDHGGIGYTLGVSVSFSRQWVFFFFFLATWHSVHEKAMRKYEDVSNGHIQTCGFSSPTSHTFFN